MIRRQIKKIIVPKNCFFCKEKKEPDYKEVEFLERYLSERSKILSKSKTGVCMKHQKRLSRAVKRARFLGLLPFATTVR